MNERIEKLIDDAKLTAVSEMFGDDLAKFAELIVRECMGIVEKNESDMHYDNGMYPVYPTVCEIREHFGVEE